MSEIEDYEGIDIFGCNNLESGERGSLSMNERAYLSEVMEYPNDLATRIDELLDSIPPKAIDSNRDIAKMIEPVKDNFDVTLLEAPSDVAQIESISNTLESMPELDYSNWKEMSVEERVAVIQEAEIKIAEIEHRPPCPIVLEPMGELTFGNFSFADKTIILNSDYLESNSFNDYKETLGTLIHEGRHAYQDYNMNERQVHPRGGIVDNWQFNGYDMGYLDCETFGFELYSSQPLEADATAFARDVLSNYLRS